MTKAGLMHLLIQSGLGVLAPRHEAGADTSGGCLGVFRVFFFQAAAVDRLQL